MQARVLHAELLAAQTQPCVVILVPRPPWVERALAIAETAYGPDHPTVGVGLNTLALILGELSDFAAARPLAERALAITETASGPRHVVGGVDEGP